MASPEEKLGVPVAEAAAEADGEIVEPLDNYDPQDYSGEEPDYITSKHLKEQAQAEGVAKEDKEGNNWKGLENLKSTFIATGVVVVVIGVIFALAKKIKQA